MRHFVDRNRGKIIGTVVLLAFLACVEIASTTSVEPMPWQLHAILFIIVSAFTIIVWI